MCVDGIIMEVMYTDGGGQWPHVPLQFMHLNIMFFLMIRHIHSCGKLNIYNPF